MYRFLLRPKWIGFTLLVVGAVVLMLNLSRWQLHRLEDRRAFNELVEQRLAEPAVPLSVLDEEPLDVAEWRTVVATGTYEGETDRVPTTGGYLLVTPLRTDTGATVFVNRGSIGSADEVPPPPTGPVEVTARLRTPPNAATAVPDDALYVDRIASAPDEPDVAAPPPPSLSEGSHLSYSVQWAVFAVCVAIGWVLAVRKSARAAAGGPERPRARAGKHQAVPWQDPVPSGAPPSSPDDR